MSRGRPDYSIGTQDAQHIVKATDLSITKSGSITTGTWHETKEAVLNTSTGTQVGVYAAYHDDGTLTLTVSNLPPVSKVILGYYIAVNDGAGYYTVKNSAGTTLFTRTVTGSSSTLVSATEEIEIQTEDDTITIAHRGDVYGSGDVAYSYTYYIIVEKVD